MRAILAALVVAGLAPLNHAGHAATSPNEASRAAYARFKALDRDGDGRLTRGELLSRGGNGASDSLFVMLDANGDGRLSSQELQARGNSGARLGRFDAYDVNKDSYVPRREFPIALDSRLFDALDGDRDDRLSLSEINPAFAGWHPVRPETRMVAEEEDAAKADTRPWCWIPTFGEPESRWQLQAPVVFDGAGCRTQ